LTTTTRQLPPRPKWRCVTVTFGCTLVCVCAVSCDATTGRTVPKRVNVSALDCPSVRETSKLAPSSPNTETLATICPELFCMLSACAPAPEAVTDAPSTVVIGFEKLTEPKLSRESGKPSATGISSIHSADESDEL